LGIESPVVGRFDPLRVLQRFGGGWTRSAVERQNDVKTARVKCGAVSLPELRRAKCNPGKRFGMGLVGLTCMAGAILFLAVENNFLLLKTNEIHPQLCATDVTMKYENMDKCRCEFQKRAPPLILGTFVISPCWAGREGPALFAFTSLGHGKAVQVRERRIEKGEPEGSPSDGRCFGGEIRSSASARTGRSGVRHGCRRWPWNPSRRAPPRHSHRVRSGLSYSHSSCGGSAR